MNVIKELFIRCDYATKYPFIFEMQTEVFSGEMIYSVLYLLWNTPTKQVGGGYKAFHHIL